MKRVSAADHAERLISYSKVVHHVDVWPLTGNTGLVYVGGPETVASAEQGCELDADQNEVFTNPVSPIDLKDLYVDALNDNDGVAFVYWTDEL